MLNPFNLTEAELKKLLLKLRDEKPLSRDHARLKELCRCSRFTTMWNGMTTNFTFFYAAVLREEVDELAEQSVGRRRGGSLRRRMSRGVSSFRRQVCFLDLSFIYVFRYVYCICLPYTYVFHICLPFRVCLSREAPFIPVYLEFAFWVQNRFPPSMKVLFWEPGFNLVGSYCPS